MALSCALKAPLLHIHKIKNHRWEREMVISTECLQIFDLYIELRKSQMHDNFAFVRR